MYAIFLQHLNCNPNAVFCRTLCKLWGECGWWGDGLYRHGPGLPRGLLHLHDLRFQAQREALLCRGKEGLLRTLLYRESDLLNVLYAHSGSHTLFTFYHLRISFGHFLELDFKKVCISSNQRDLPAACHNRTSHTLIVKCSLSRKIFARCTTGVHTYAIFTVISFWSLRNVCEFYYLLAFWLYYVRMVQMW